VRRAELILYVLLIVGEVAWAAFVPLGPVFERRFDLSATQTGALLSAASVAILVVSLPAGVLADRFGARRLTVVGTVTMAAGMFAQAAPGFWSLLGARGVFGIGFGMVWSAGVALLAQVVPPARRSAALALTITLAAVGMMVGPAYAGTLVDTVGTGWPFAVLGALSVAAAAALMASPAASGRGDGPAALQLGAALRAAGREPLILGALVCMALPGFVNNAVNLLVPLQLDHLGVSTTATGLAYSLAAVLFVLESAFVSRRAARLATLRVGAAGALVLAAVHVLPLVVAGSAALVVFLCLRTPANALLLPVSVPLAVRGAERAGIGRGTVIGLLNAAWATAATAGPLAAGAVADVAGTKAAYAGAVVIALGCAAWLARPRVAVPMHVD
jgi:predicted MFS family arabinose efflux permease